MTTSNAGGAQAAPIKYGLTRRQSELLAYLRERRGAGDVGPTMEEISQALGLKSKSRVFDVLNGLEKRGYIRRLRHVARSITLVEYDDV